MPDRDLSKELKARLSAELTSGVPLNAPLPSLARYAMAAPAARPQGHLRGRMVTLAVAALVVLLAAAFAGPPQQRAWLVRTVGNLAGDLGAEVSTSSPSPGHSAPAASSPRGGTDDRSPSPSTPDADETPGAQESPEPRESAEPSQTPEAQVSPEAGESPQPSASPDAGGSSGDDGDHSSPTPSPSPDGGGSDDGH